MSKFNQLIVGGGIAGLLSSILLKHQSPEKSVCLIEAEKECGGLLRSIKTDEGFEFDYGTHILGETGVKELDDILMPKMPSNDWSCLPQLKPGSFVNGYLHKYSQFIYAKALPQSILEKGTYQLLSANHEKTTQATNLLEYCLSTYGDTFTQSIFAPLMQKLMNEELQNLHPSSLSLFGYDRLILGGAKMMRDLKKTSYLDKILGYETYDEGISSLNNYYPKNGKGIGLWVEELVKKARELGVVILTDTKIEQLHVDNGHVSALQTSNVQHAEISVEKIIWTAPLFPLIKLANLNFSPQYKPKMSKVRLHHFVFDRPFTTHNFHVYCNDPSMKSFRVTLYPNIAEEHQVNGEIRCTVEVLTNSEEEANDKMEESIIDELRTMGIIDSQTMALYRSTLIINNGFPSFTNQFVEELNRQKNCVQSQLGNVLLLGKASANSFFMGDVLKEVFFAIKDNEIK